MTAMTNHDGRYNLPYRGEGPAQEDLIAGRLDYMCSTIQTGALLAKQGLVKAIAAMSPRRVGIIPDLPTTGEQGLPGVEASVWDAYFLPPGAPGTIVRTLNKAISEALDDPAVHRQLKDLGLEIAPPDERTPEYLAKFVPEEIARWSKVVRAAGFTPNKPSSRLRERRGKLPHAHHYSSIVPAPGVAMTGASSVRRNISSVSS